jgi:3-oxoacyl-[acyl-carrier protein] reductase
LASKGASLILNYMSDISEEATTTLAKELEEQHGTRCFSIKADLGSSEGPSSLISAAREHFTNEDGDPFRIDILVNNAGVAKNSTIAQTTVEDFEWMYTVNVRGPLLLVKAVLPYFPRDRSARIVNVSSISSTEGFVEQSIYGGTKAALEAMTRTWARELAECGTVNAVNPGPVKTDMWDRMPIEHRSGLNPWNLHTPLAAVRVEHDQQEIVSESKVVGGRPGYPSEVAGIVGMLCTEESGWCTGQVVCANGGMRMAI